MTYPSMHSTGNKKTIFAMLRSCARISCVINVSHPTNAPRSLLARRCCRPSSTSMALKLLIRDSHVALSAGNTKQLQTETRLSNRTTLTHFVSTCWYVPTDCHLSLRTTTTRVVLVKAPVLGQHHVEPADHHMITTTTPMQLVALLCTLPTELHKGS
jgi:hypothetical protein